MKSYETLLTETVGAHLLRVTLNRPEVGNAKNTQMGLDLLDLWTGLVDDPGEVRCVILTGAGDRIFCAGGDLKQRKTLTTRQWQYQHEIFERGRDALLECPVPVIAAINGHAYAGGLETLLVCDFAYAVPTARFALTEVTIGIMPGGGGTQTLARRVGEARAKEIILTGKPFTAQQALDWGVVNRVCEPGTLMDAVMETAQAICDNAPLSVRQAKKSIHHGLQIDLKRGLMFEIEAYNRLVDTEDRREGVLAFNEKRKPVFKGR
ncbi:MAG TPA: enoyl-CoA hydratase-related protein [Rhodopila sp.]|jgi:enoyl-CoA hydratase/carnithine racemase|nr:enoyl-CoA hydratase-related protein [Rhodopila sp.]